MKVLFGLILAAAMVLPASAGVLRSTAKATAKTADYAVHMSAASVAKDAAHGVKATAKFAEKGTVKVAKFLFHVIY